jgi:hypothetical protein
MDTDAATYIAAVEIADGQALEERTKIAIDNFVLGCKSDGIWTALKASCILAGARTLAGALVPLAGTAPTNNNFDSGDYNRKTGLMGNGSTKWLNTNRAGNTDPQNNAHASVFASTLGSTGTTATPSFYLGSLVSGGNTNISLGRASSLFYGRIRDENAFLVTESTGLLGAARASSSALTVRANRASTIVTQTSNTASSDRTGVFARTTNSAIDLPTNARLAFYSIGESLDLPKLDSRVTDLITAFGVAIP